MAVYLGSDAVDLFGGTPITEGGGAKLLYSSEVTASTTSTSGSEVATLETGIEFELGKTYAVLIRDKAGKRNGYFYGCFHIFSIFQSPFASDTSLGSLCFGVSSDGTYNRGTTARGVYVYRFYGGSNMGNLQIYKRYDSARGTVDGTYTVKLYELPTEFALP